MHAFVGTGVNHTLFFDEKTGGPLEDSKLTLDDSIGLAFDLGNDSDAEPRCPLYRHRYRRGAEWHEDATVEIDPLAYGLTLGWRF
jgi:outer membrane protein